MVVLCQCLLLILESFHLSMTLLSSLLVPFLEKVMPIISHLRLFRLVHNFLQEMEHVKVESICQYTKFYFILLLLLFYLDSLFQMIVCLNFIKYKYLFYPLCFLLVASTLFMLNLAPLLASFVFWWVMR